MELKMVADAVSAYEDKRRPDGVVPGGKGSRSYRKVESLACTRDSRI
jgi:hypothetical protein